MPSGKNMMSKPVRLKINANVVLENTLSGIRLVADSKVTVRLYIKTVIHFISGAYTKRNSSPVFVISAHLSESQQTGFGVEIFNKIG